MAYDIFGNDLRRGYCEVHPHVHQEYPCDICYRDIEKNNRQQNRPEYTYGNNEQIDPSIECTRVVIEMLITKIQKSSLEDGILDIDFGGNYLIQIKKEDNDDLWKITNAMNGYGQNCFDEFKDSKVFLLSN